MPNDQEFTRATLKPEGGAAASAVTVHFNPVSLQYSITNQLKEQAGTGGRKKQYVSQSTGKLTMDLIFDTTNTGQDVRVETEKVAKFMEPDAQKIPPVILFEWGAYKFKGMVESYKETVDFFAANGVPLRASVNLTMASQDEVFELTSGDRSFNMRQRPTLDAVEVPGSGGRPRPGPGGPAGQGSGANQDATSIATRGGNPSAGRAIAAANNLESMRFTEGPLTVGGSVPLGPPVAFATGGASVTGGAGLSLGAGAAAGISAGGGFGVSGGGGIGISGGAGFAASGGAGLSGGAGFAGAGGAGIGAGGGASFSAAGAGFGGSAGAGFDVAAGASFQAGAGFSASAGAVLSAAGGAGISIEGGATVATTGFSASFGGRSSARVSASAGAFAGLRASTTASRSISIKTEKLIRRTESVSLATDRGATFQVGGQARIEGSASLRADVGANASLHARIQFDED